ncbi:glycosyltransferase [Bombilactobacillus folatiphilus]|uniref:Glycosyltransferase n=1 Tax=Bombilactobacillus folatiphilus TaxID=2923362 RepID=A0ABY4P8B9_9LACO|nr:glycosyltransferase [Bombilactobacillus folatiphilus]UQS81862.1 glycosyltransferase [Bombilactobacillus folatiphilus]
MRLFHEHQEPAKIVTISYRNNWADGPGKFDVQLDDVINIFDYFGQNHTDFYQANPVQAYCKQHRYHIVQRLGQESNENGYQLVTEDGRQALLRADVDTGQIVSITFSTVNSSQTNYAEGYDARGFLSIKYFYDQHGQVTKQEIFNDQGHSFCTQVFKNGRVVLYKIKFRNQKYTFTDIRDLHGFFYDCLNEDYGEHNLFISDRMECTQGLPRMKTAAKKGFYIHNQFVNSWQADIMTAPFNYNYDYGLTHNDQFDLIFCPTKWEKQEINQRLNLGEKVQAMPSGNSQVGVPQVKMDQRDPHLIMMVARISPEKQVTHALKILKQVRKQDPLAHLEVYGGITVKEEAELVNKTVQDLHLQNHVSFKGIVSDLAPIYDRARVVLVTSYSEGLSLALLEANSHGVPMVSYNCRYGPSEIVQDDQNGYLVPQDDIDLAAQKVSQILQDDQLAQRLSDGAYNTVDPFSPATSWQKWQHILDTIQAEKASN